MISRIPLYTWLKTRAYTPIKSSTTDCRQLLRDIRRDEDCAERIKDINDLRVKCSKVYTIMESTWKQMWYDYRWHLTGDQQCIWIYNQSNLSEFQGCNRLDGNSSGSNRWHPSLNLNLIVQYYYDKYESNKIAFKVWLQLALRCHLQIWKTL